MYVHVYVYIKKTYLVVYRALNKSCINKILELLSKKQKYNLVVCTMKIHVTTYYIIMVFFVLFTFLNVFFKM